ncbi:hypothetical protein KJ708_02220 [bacterium]|nr:hypothetical protein [bacterium]MBU1918646.1 hypothetical protein [bacterium]
MPLASIDIGTNTIILLIAEKENNTLRTIHHECQMPRLGEDINKTRSLKPEAINRSLDVLKNYKKTIERYQCEQIILIATAACRKAQNILDFTTRVQEKLGLNIMIIPGEEEARLIHKTCAIEFKELGPPFIVLDIGGGSTEIITDSGDNVTYNSLDFGVVTLTQKFLHTKPQQLTKLNHYVNI